MRNLRARISYLFFAIILTVLGCSRTQERTIKQRLEGQWIHELQPIFGDTIYREIIDDFDGYKQSERIIRKLNSGIFELTYVDGGLSQIGEYRNVWVIEFKFLSDTSGIVFNYELDTTLHYKKHPRVTADSDQFSIQVINEINHIFRVNGATSDLSRLNFKNSDELELIHNDSEALVMRKFTSSGNSKE